MNFLRPTKRVLLTFATLVLVGFLLSVVSENVMALLGFPYVLVHVLFSGVREGDISYTRMPILADTLSWVATLIPFYLFACIIEWLRKRGEHPRTVGHP